MKKKRLAQILLGVALVGGAVGAIWRFVPRESLLLQRAAAIAATVPWHQGERFRHDMGVHWLSDDALLYCRFEGTDGRERVVYRRKVKTGQEEKLPGLTAVRNDFAAEVVDDQGVSPDGCWYVCSSRWDECLLAEVNGSRHYLYPSVDSSAYRSLHWMPDGHHWLENYVNGETLQLVLHDTENPKFSRSLLPQDARAKELFGALKAILSPQEAISVVDPNPDTDGFSDPPLQAKTPKVLTVTRISLDAPATAQAQYHVTVPGGTAQYKLALSPRGDRIAWQVTTLRSDTARNWLHRFLPFIQPNSRRQIEVWVSALDGSELHEVGSIEEKPNDSEQDAPVFHSLQWLPGGKSLSFEYRDVLYTVPAD